MDISGDFGKLNKVAIGHAQIKDTWGLIMSNGDTEDANKVYNYKTYRQASNDQNRDVGLYFIQFAI
jgi:hypothetical protein